MSESSLTQALIDQLRDGQIRKLVKLRKPKTIELRREVGNNSFRADIFISLTDSKKNRIRYSALTSTKFIAIEVKIKDWKQGLYQAWRYNSFAEKSYLALYKPFAKKVDVSLFEKYNVGLILFTEKEIEILNHPKAVRFKKSDSYSDSIRNQILLALPTMKSVQPVI